MEWMVHRQALPEFAPQFWQAAGSARVFLFVGHMGAGKTTLIEALCRAKGVQESMGSPTFSIINEYAYLQDGASKSIYHIDLYRLKDEEEIIAAGVEDCVYSGALCFVEWPQKAPDLFDETCMVVKLEVVGEEERRVRIEAGPLHPGAGM